MSDPGPKHTWTPGAKITACGRPVTTAMKLRNAVATRLCTQCERAVRLRAGEMTVAVNESRESEAS